MKKEEKNELEEIIEKTKIEKGQPVYLNIYHLSSINYIIQIIGLGFFHSSLEINNIEYSYSATDDEGVGIFKNRFIEESKNIILKEKIYLGNTIFNDEQINEILMLNVPYWLGKSYDPFLKNCNHFTNFFARLLLNEEDLLNYPTYINRFTDYGLYFNAFYTPIKRLYKNAFINQNNGIVVSDNVKVTVKSNNNDSNSDYKKKHNYSNVELENLSFKTENPTLRDINLNVFTHSDLSNHNLNYSAECDKKKLFNKNTNDNFFHRTIRKNFFIKPIFYNGNNLSMKKLFKADYFLLEKKYFDSLSLYQNVLKDLEKDHNLYMEFEKSFSLTPYKYWINKNSKYKKIPNTILKIRILHCIYYIFFLTDDINNQEVVSNSIYNLNSGDYFSIFYLAYVKFKQNKIPECNQIIKSGIENCDDEDFKKYFIHFEKIIDDLVLN